MRNLSTAMRTAVTARSITPAILVELTFRSGVARVWTGIGDLINQGNTFRGVGALGGIGTITEGITVEAAGTSVTLSGVDPTLYADSMTDIITGQPAKVWLACLANGAVIDTMILFSGMVDIPTVEEGGDKIDITIALENKLVNLQRANRRLWTSAEQRRKYPNDSGCDSIAVLQDTTNEWG